MDIHAIALLDYMPSTVIRLFIVFIVLVESTENAVIQKNWFTSNCDIGWDDDNCSSIDFCFNSPYGEHGICQNNPFNLTCFCDDRYIEHQCKEYDYCIEKPCKNNLYTQFLLMFMEHVYHIQMVTSTSACICGRVKSVMNGTFAI